MKALTVNDVVALLKQRQGTRTARALAEEIGVSPAYLSDVYNGRRDPGPYILEFLGVEKGYIKLDSHLTGQTTRQV